MLDLELPFRDSTWHVACSLSSRLPVVAAGALIFGSAAYTSFSPAFRTATPTLRPRVDQHIRENLGQVGNTALGLRDKKGELLCLVSKPVRRPLRLWERLVTCSACPLRLHISLG